MIPWGWFDERRWEFHEDGDCIEDWYCWVASHSVFGWYLVVR